MRKLAHRDADGDDQRDKPDKARIGAIFEYRDEGPLERRGSFTGHWLAADKARAADSKGKIRPEHTPHAANKSIWGTRLPPTLPPCRETAAVPPPLNRLDPKKAVS